MRRIRQENYFPAIVGLHFILWAVDLTLFDVSFADDADTMLAGSYQRSGFPHPMRIAGEALSSWVVTVLAFNFLMATRARWVERLFGGLDKMYLVHRRAGIIATLLLLAHFVVVPRHMGAFTVGKPLGLAALILMFAGVILSAAPPLKKRLPYHRWLGIHRWMGIFYVIGLVHAVKVDALMWHLPLTRVYVACMAFVGVGAWFYRAFLYRVHRPERPYEVKSVEASNGTLEVKLDAQDAPLSHTPGQFAFFRFPSISNESHPFTIASEGEPLRLIIKGLGDYTKDELPKLQVGARAFVDGPFGEFVQREEGAQTWVAGGIGITPFLAMAPTVDRPTRLFWSVRTEQEAAQKEELLALARANPNLEFELWCSDEHGHLSGNHLLGPSPANQRYFLCGPAKMKHALRKQLRALGVPNAKIHDEDFAFR